ncbi:MAG: peptidoglycan-associated lipoprotein Pal [Candidatus Omnitrophota bacterium]|jgi:peptidoglycan-associated lipoprotein|nr:MAG: peptidoglycan-associated lipoprotein Pal [Candidatus Omnitrophota bacterium]
MKQTMLIILGVVTIIVAGWAIVGETGAVGLNAKIERPWLCPTQLYLKADLQEINHPDLFKWRFAKKAPPVEPEPVVTPPPTPPPTEPQVREPEPLKWEPMPEKLVYFDYDKSMLRPEAKAAIQKNVQFLKENPNTRILIEGHCDERGTNEYNLALGERRAESVKNYMIELGIDSSRISTKSWGEEKPVAQGHNEAAWKQNRRAEMFFARQQQ